MRKCKNGHEMEHKGKHCGECGSPEEPAMTLKCVTCADAEPILKSAATKFFPCCGTAVESDADLEQALDGVAAFEKSRLAIEADLADLPEAPQVDADDKQVTEILKAATVLDADGKVEGLRPDPLFEAVLAGQASASADARVLATHQQAWNKHLAASTALLVKAVGAMGREIVALKSQLAERGTRPRTGPKAIPAAAHASTAADTSGDDSTRLKGHALFVKCRQVGAEKPDLALGIEEIGQLEQHANMGHSLVEIVKSKRPWLAQRVAELVGESMPSKDELTTVH